MQEWVGTNVEEKRGQESTLYLELNLFNLASISGCNRFLRPGTSAFAEIKTEASSARCQVQVKAGIENVAVPLFPGNF